MQRLVHCVSMAGALVALAVSVWRGESAWTALRRAGIAYIGFFTVGTLLALVYRAGVVAETPAPPAPPAPVRGGASAGVHARAPGQAPPGESR